MLPLVRRILVDLRRERSRLSRMSRSNQPSANSRDRVTPSDFAATLKRIVELVGEIESLGLEVTPGVRCVALFPFLHRWAKPGGDGKIRQAFFVYSDANETIHEWFFDGWPRDRRRCSSAWWQQYREGQRRRLETV